MSVPDAAFRRILGTANAAYPHASQSYAAPVRANFAPLLTCWTLQRVTYTTSLRHKRMQFVPSSLNVRRHHSPLYAHLAHGTRTTLHQPTRALFFISRGMHVHPSSRSLPFYCWPAIDLPAVLACPYLHTIGRRAHGQRAHAPPLVCKWVGGWRFEGTPKERYFYPGPCAQRAYVPTDSHHDSSAIQIETTMSLLSRLSLIHI